jgi:hypothetical protein
LKIGTRKNYDRYLNMIISKYEMMAKRITVMIDDDIDKKLRQYQAKMIQQSSGAYSYSKTLNDVLKKSLK